MEIGITSVNQYVYHNNVKISHQCNFRSGDAIIKNREEEPHLLEEKRIDLFVLDLNFFLI